LFAEFGSLLVDETVAVLVARLDELNIAAVVLMVTTAKPPTLNVPMVQLTVPPAWEQVPWVVETETKVTCGTGNGSETTTPVATPGPLFVICNVYVRLVP